MRRFVLGLFATIGILAVLAVVAVGVAAWHIAASRPALPRTIILTADLGGGLIEGSQSALSELVGGRKSTVRGFLDALERGAEDPRVKGIYAHIDGDTLGLAKTQEVRDAVAAFRGKGKFAIAFSESFGEFGVGTRPYYLATAFDEKRIAYVDAALREVQACLAAGIEVRSYLYWSLLDNFEWSLGYAPTFGMVAVDRQTFARRPKPSAHWFGQVARARAVPAPR